MDPVLDDTRDALLLAGELFQKGPTPELITRLARNRKFSEVTRSAGANAPRDPDEAGADHYHVFGFNVFPYASVYLDAEGLIGRQITAEARQAEAQLRPTAATEYPDTEAEPDHAARELVMCASTHNLGVLTGFMDRHVFRWFPMFAGALQRLNHPFYAPLASDALQMLAAVRSEIQIRTSEPAASFEAQQTSADPAADEGKSAISRLAVASHCGLFLSRADLQAMGRKLNVPCGFGSRVRMLQTLEESAARFEVRAAMGQALDKACEMDEALWTGLAESSVLLESIAHEPLARLRRTRRLISEWSVAESG